MASADTMTLHVRRLPGVASLARAVQHLAAAVETFGTRSSDALDRIEMEIEPLDIMAWVASQQPGQRTMFRNREGSLEMASLGCLFAAPSLEDARVQRLLEQEPPIFPRMHEPASPFLVTSCVFDADAPITGVWSAFGAMRVSLPLIEVRRMRTVTTLAVHVNGDPSRSLDALRALRQPTSVQRVALRLESDSDPSHWARMVDAALDAIVSRRLDKVVVARTRRYRAVNAIDPMALLMSLRSAANDVFQIAVEAAPGSSFVSITPERLFKRKGRVVHTEAIAGTCPRGPDMAADAWLASRLLASAKNRLEHDLVLERIKAVLVPWSDQLDAEPTPGIVRLAHVQHLMTSVSARMSDDVRDSALLAALHPTPAVCGTPTEAARAFIAAHEGDHRGLYAGVVGLVSASRSDFAVGIRSALVHGDQAVAFGGAGIVRGSEADAEWLETARKMESFDAVS
ncbi:MAG: isochorismate synthase [Planctomycetes bacterium]|nr:isochorismate synthase [Planctomycetota bacterium]